LKFLALMPEMGKVNRDYFIVTERPTPAMVKYAEKDFKCVLWLIKGPDSLLMAPVADLINWIDRALTACGVERSDYLMVVEVPKYKTMNQAKEEILGAYEIGSYQKLAFASKAGINFYRGAYRIHGSR